MSLRASALQNLQRFLAPAITLLLGAMLVTTIYFTLFDLQWVAFLAGVLFAAVAAVTGQTAKAQWLVLRRTRQLERIKAQLADTSARCERAEAALAAAELRLQPMTDATDIPQSAPPRDGTAGDVVVVPQDDGEGVYLQSMVEQLISGDDPRARLVRALEEDQFLLFAQRIEPLARDAPYAQCAEILLRLQEEERHMLPPGGFFPVAERYGLMREIDRWVVSNLLKWCATRRRDHRDWRMPLYCVNVCGDTLDDAGFAHFVQGETERYCIPAGNLCFEIAEPDLLDHYRGVRTLMRALKPLGYRFTADAFGSVKISFAPFKELRFDFVKIDGAIIQNVLREESDVARTRAIALACRKVGARTIAEFVESDETLARLRDLGVDYAQGFGVATPVRLEELTA